MSNSELNVAGTSYRIFTFDDLPAEKILTLPYCLKILLENLLRHQHEIFVTNDDIEALVNWNPSQAPSQEIGFVPARVLLQDFTGVPAVVDLAAMRDAMDELGGDVGSINPLVPVDLVIDHSVMVDHFGSPEAFKKNTDREVQRNIERYQFLRWGQQAFSNFRIVPPGTGIVHQVNLEYLASTVFVKDTPEGKFAYPDSLVGTDSHTTMINGLGVLGWGVGGIEAEAAMLGQPISMLIPEVVGFQMSGALPEGTTATDLVLTVTQQLREHNVVGKFVEFYGDGLSSLSLADRATISNMAPEYGATCGIFPVDEKTLEYLRLSGREEQQVQLVEAYMRAMGMWHDAESVTARYSSTLSLNLTDVIPSIAGPKRPQDRIALKDASQAFKETLSAHQSLNLISGAGEFQGEPQLEDGAVVIAAITSCTNTSNPSVMVAAGLLAKKAMKKGLMTKPWVKTSLAPGSKVVTDYLNHDGLLESLEALGFYLVGYGCTTCIGNSGPLPEEMVTEIQQRDLLVTSVLSGNRNFEGRIHSEVRANYLASPPLVVAYALAGNMNINIATDALGVDQEGKNVYLRDLWPDTNEVQEFINQHIDAGLFQEKYRDVFSGDQVWQDIPVESGARYPWPESTYVRQPPFFQDMQATPKAVTDITDARCLVSVGDSITTDHISPAGSIETDSPAGSYLQGHSINKSDFNSYGSRRGNHEVMMRGTFANVRLRTQLAPGTEGSFTNYLPDREQMSIYDAAMKYQTAGVPTIVLAGKEYGTGSSRDWAAKGPALLGVKAVIAESFERIHRSNLIGMGILPLQFCDGETAGGLGLNGHETFTIEAPALDSQQVMVSATNEDGKTMNFSAVVRIDTPNEYYYFENGGILSYVLRNLAD